MGHGIILRKSFLLWIASSSSSFVIRTDMTRLHQQQNAIRNSFATIPFLVPRKIRMAAAAVSSAAVGNSSEPDTEQFISSSSTSFYDYADVLQRMQDLAGRSSRDETAVEQAQTLLNQVSLHMRTIELYNLLWETYAYADHVPDGGDTIAKQIQQQQQQLKQTDNDSRPNLESYEKLMEAYTQRSQLEQVEAVTDMLQSHGLKPNIHIYNKLLRAYAIMGQADKAKSVITQLLEQQQQQQQGGEDLRPNAKTWMNLLRSLAVNSLVDEIQYYISDVMTKGYQLHGQRDWKPNVHSYNSLMRALINQNEKDNNHIAVEGLLYDMIRKSREDDTTTDKNDNEDGSHPLLFEMRPNAETFLLVIQSFRGSTESCVADKMERILELQRGLARSCSKQEDGGSMQLLWPDTRTYNTAISVLSRCRDPKKAIRAKRLLDQMDDEKQQVQQQPQQQKLQQRQQQQQQSIIHAQPNLITYRNILNTCAFTQGSQADKLAAFQIAVDVYNRVRTVEMATTTNDDAQQPRADSMIQIYQLFLKACFNLLPPSPKRDSIVEKVFTNCCHEGYLSDQIVNKVLIKHASKDLQWTLFGGFLENDTNIPPEWNRNVPSHR